MKVNLLIGYALCDCMFVWREANWREASWCEV